MDKSPVYFAECPVYDAEKIAGLLRDALAALGFDESRVRGRRVLIKPNLVLALKPEVGATTHPSFVRAAVEVLSSMGAEKIVLADSPGGPYNAASISHVYKVCGMDQIDDPRLTLNADYGFSDASAHGVRLHSFHVLNPFSECDLVVDLCKLKSHELTGMSCAVKNLFGLIPGTEKFEAHNLCPQIADFSELLVDLAAFVTREKDFLAICDGVLSMEGNGPTHGVPKETGIVLVSESPFTLDIAAEHIMGRDGEVLHLDAAAKRGFTPRDVKEITVLGTDSLPVFDFVRADADAGSFLRGLPNFMGGRLVKFFEPRPMIKKEICVGCGKCAENCPRHTIQMKKKGKKRLARIVKKNCIKCWCCQELCPKGAVGVKRNPIIKLIH
ncbi:MAG: DUF362 domain-containing protein [Clostridia bacterium]|nr:DUF362 domain-containing protein [Clostridia bacterium]